MQVQTNPAPGSAAEAFLKSYGFACPVLNATITKSGCDAYRARPAEERKLGCDDRCTARHNAPATWPRKAPESAAWKLVRAQTGCTSYIDLSNRIKERFGRCNNNSIGRIFADLDRGELPRGSTWTMLLRYTGMTAAQLLHPDSSAPAAAQVVDEQGQPKAVPAGDIAHDIAHPSHIEPMPGQAPPVVIPEAPADLEGEKSSEGVDSPDDLSWSEEKMRNLTVCSPADAALLSKQLDAACTSEALPTREEVEELGRKVGATLAMRCADIARECGPMDFDAIARERSGIPSDFALYDCAPAQGRPIAPPSIAFERGDRITISGAAVQAFGLANVGTVGLRFSAARGMLAIQPGYSGPGARKLTSRRTGGLQRCISAGQILRTWGLKTRRGAHYPLTIGPGGLLVATIAAPARAGKEA